MFTKAKWIAGGDVYSVSPIFRKEFETAGQVVSAVLNVTAQGLYEATLNGARVGEFVLAPGWTVYDARIQVQKYDVTALLNAQNTLDITLATGWYCGRISRKKDRSTVSPAVIAELVIDYADGTRKIIATGEDWTVGKSGLYGCDIYDGQRFDASYTPAEFVPVTLADSKAALIETVGEEIRAQETLRPSRFFKTPKGELVADFGQNLTGVPQITVTAHAGDEIKLSFAEIMDPDGNFYTDNYRSAKCLFEYVCKEGEQTYRPTLTFYGFRYLRIDKFPCEVTKDTLAAVVYCSDMKRTGFIATGDTMVNRLFSNVIWGQKSNYLDVPTDCPQRDERLGWTGDAEVFAKTAAYNFDVSRFFRKWLGDMRIDQQRLGGFVPNVVPAVFGGYSAAWGDVGCIAPWQMYLTYGNLDDLQTNFPMMRDWVDFITRTTKEPNCWRRPEGSHYADWLGLDAPYGQYKGSTREKLIADAYYAYSTELVIKAGKVLGEDVSAYEALYTAIRDTFRKNYEGDYRTQTELVLAAHFRLAADPQAAADALAQKVHADGDRLMTGFVGTPYILHVLADYGHADVAYTLLLRRDFPSWLYPITKGATTMWEHWDGIMPDGRIWSRDMNSFNHYAYGAVADWIYEKAAGITPAQAGFAKLRFAPLPDERLGELSVRFESVHGTVESGWHYADGTVRYRIVTPVPAVAVIEGKEYELSAGAWEF